MQLLMLQFNMKRHMQVKKSLLIVPADMGDLSRMVGTAFRMAEGIKASAERRATG